MIARFTPIPAKLPSPFLGKDLEPELLEIIRALARDAARRDHEKELAAQGKK